MRSSAPISQEESTTPAVPKNRSWMVLVAAFIILAVVGILTT